MTTPPVLSALIFGLDATSGAKYNPRGVDLAALRDLRRSEATLRATGAVHPRFYYCNIDVASDVEELKRVIRDGDGGRPWDTIGIGFGVRGNPDLTVWFEEMLNYAVEHGRGARLTFTSAPMEHLESMARHWPHLRQYLPAGGDGEEGV